MEKGFVAKTSVLIHASSDKVWEAITNLESIKQFMFDTTVTSDWKVGSPIVFQGVWEGKPFEDHGKIKKIVPGKILQYTHISEADGLDEVHTVTYELEEKDGQTKFNLTQDNNANEEARKRSENNWNTMLDSLKKLLEK